MKTVLLAISFFTLFSYSIIAKPDIFAGDLKVSVAKDNIIENSNQINVQLLSSFDKFSHCSFSTRTHFGLDEYGLTKNGEELFITIARIDNILRINLYTKANNIMSLNMNPINSRQIVIDILEKNNVDIRNYPEGSDSFLIRLFDQIKNHDYIYWERLDDCKAKEVPENINTMPIIDNLQYRTQLIIDIIEHNPVSKKDIKKYSRVPDCYELYPIHYAILRKTTNLYIKDILIDKDFSLPVHQPIYLAISAKNYQAIEFLLNSGADPLGFDSGEGDSAYPRNMHLLAALDDSKALSLYLKYISKEKQNEEWLQYVSIKNEKIEKRIHNNGALIRTNLAGYALIGNSYEGIMTLKKNGIRIAGTIKVYSDDQGEMETDEFAFTENSY
jgi:hypothetical protein